MSRIRKEIKNISVSSNSNRLQNAKKKLEDEFKTKVLTYQQDMGKIGAAIQLYKRTKEDNLNISILINNAGI